MAKINFVCASVPGGWQTEIAETGQRIGPVFNSCAALWQWQKKNLHREEPSASQTVIL